jgi:hypothetical protein
MQTCGVFCKWKRRNIFLAVESGLLCKPKMSLAKKLPLSDYWQFAVPNSLPCDRATEQSYKGWLI